ncbi:MAG: YkgJ family cysteine cluster protein [Deltaproteobacteria bacterium]|nr:YkgJ family cysteine cluster protein [Deltaproteobacteria bacterium]
MSRDPRSSATPKKGGARKKSVSKKLTILPNAMTPLVDDDGHARTPTPHRPVLNACSICRGFCCFRHEVHLSVADALRFSRVLSLPFFAALRFVASAHDEVSFELDVDPRRDDERPWTGRVEIALSRTAEGRCVMFHETAGYGRCGAYDARPSLCRLYPLSWTSDLARGGPLTILCPVPYGVSTEVEEKFYADAAVAIESFELQKELVREWSLASEPGRRTARALLEHVAPLAATKLGLEPKVVEIFLDRRDADQQILAAQLASLRRAERPRDPDPIP